MSATIFTDRARNKMASFGLSEAQVLDAFRNGIVEKWTNGKGFNVVKKYTGYEIGVAYFVDERGISKITSVWKRARR